MIPVSYVHHLRLFAVYSKGDHFDSLLRSLDDLIDGVTFVSDRGSDLVMALESYRVVRCFPHRWNNVLKRTFYSAGTEDKEEQRKRKPLSVKSARRVASTSDDFAVPGGDPLMNYDDRHSSDNGSDDDVLLDPETVEMAL